jgi:membrane protein implicated in regulation of membrane protease activity
MEATGIIMLLTAAGIALVVMLGFRGKTKTGTQAARIEGQTGIVRAFTFHEGEVFVKGTCWPARLDGTSRTPAVGSQVRVTHCDGKVVWVRPLPASSVAAPDPPTL